eukprot:NODE_9864_length_1394_cov_3.290450.p6 GENE.NODE_9864_length_1394_cov_3.290450~~NODE_9864_length_1394_cov_3.290450.p6  ORF type:complete len:66 (-),score=27.32 NODE_9864_length_1394_cov_3.290450:75-272(-)
MIFRLFDDFSDREIFLVPATWAAHQNGTCRHMNYVRCKKKKKKKKKKNNRAKTAFIKNNSGSGIP